MKILQKITLLILISSCCFTMQAGRNKYNNSYKPNYNGPDLRQQKQHMHQLEKQFKNMNIGETKTKMPQMEQLEKQFQKMCIDESDQDNQVRKEASLRTNNLSYAQKTILALLATMLIVATVTATGHNQKIKTHKIPHFDWNDNSIIEAEPLSSGTKVFCKIHPLYIVECCACKSKNDCNCLSFNPDRIIGDESKNGPINASEAYQEDEAFCKAESTSFKIAKETEFPKYGAGLHYSNGTIELFATFGNYAFEPLGISKKQSNGLELSCVVIQSNIEKKDFPILFDMVENLAKKFNIPKAITSIKVFNDRICDSRLQETIPPNVEQGYYDYDDAQVCSKRTFVFEPEKNCIYATVQIPSSFLLYSNEKIMSVLAHELWHINQGKRWCHGLLQLLSPEHNNSEIEADMASFLVTGKPCLAVWLSEHVGLNQEEGLPSITSKYMFEKLNESDLHGLEHPDVKPRIAFLVTMYEHYEKVRNFLIMAEKEA